VDLSEMRRQVRDPTLMRLGFAILFGVVAATQFRWEERQRSHGPVFG
jgi:hypothetical protein